jgi:hypothetical protein
MQKYHLISKWGTMIKIFGIIHNPDAGSVLFPKIRFNNGRVMISYPPAESRSENAWEDRITQRV